jgi:hypothetical protein
LPKPASIRIWFPQFLLRPSREVHASNKPVFENRSRVRIDMPGVVDYTVHIIRRGCCSGYSFKNEPFGNDPGYEIDLWANAYGYIVLDVDVELEGLDGTGCR